LGLGTELDADMPDETFSWTHSDPEDAAFERSYASRYNELSSIIQEGRDLLDKM